MTVITEATIKELAEFRSADAPVVSCYLDIDGRREVRPVDYRRRLDSMVRATNADHPDPRVAADLERVVAHVREGVERSGVRGLAIFSCAEKGLWKVLSLPVPVANRITINKSPAVAQLEAAVHELGPLGVLLVDRQRARMFVFQFGEIIERTQLFEALPRDYDRRDDAGRGSREREQHHVDELALQHLRHSAEVAFRHFQDHGFGRLTIGATDDVYAATENVLHPYLRERLAPRIHVTVSATESEIAQAAMDVERIIEREREVAIVEKLRDAIGSHRKGTAGLADVLAALNERKVATLLVSNGFIESGWVCPCGALAVRGPKCPLDGQEMERSDDVVSDAVDAALREGAQVETCEANADLDVLGRIGALLRY